MPETIASRTVAGADATDTPKAAVPKAIRTETVALPFSGMSSIAAQLSVSVDDQGSVAAI